MQNFNISSKKELKKFIENKGFKKILILAGKRSFNLSGLKNFFSEVKSNELKFYFKEKPFPDYEELLLIINEINRYSPDLIIAAGGGSVLDYAKIANVINQEDNLNEKIISNNYKLKNNNRKLIAIPTTAGSGAEVTANAVIYINNVKYSVEGQLIKPDDFFLIPDFIKGASNKIKSSAGFDAISQSIESLISLKSNDDSVKYATRSLEISLKYFLNFLSNPNLENTSAMAFAANLSGRAISISKTTAPHAVSYPFTSLFNISHGHAVSLTLDKFMTFNYKNLKKNKSNFDLKKRYEILFNLSKSNNIEEFQFFLNNLQKKAQLENNFTNLGININNSIDRILNDVNEQRLSNNPIQIDKQIIKKILIEN